MHNNGNETMQLPSIVVDKQDLTNGIWKVISNLKPDWLEENVKYKVTL